MVYFIGCPTLGTIKIGFTEQDAKKRLSALQTGSSVPLELICVLTGGVREEAELHQRFAKYRTSGEWFAAADAIRWTYLAAEFLGCSLRDFLDATSPWDESMVPGPGDAGDDASFAAFFRSVMRVDRALGARRGG